MARLCCCPRTTPHKGLTGGLFTSQYVCSWHAMTSLSPFLRCLAALGGGVGRAGGTLCPPPHPPLQAEAWAGSQAWVRCFWSQGCQCPGRGRAGHAGRGLTAAALSPASLPGPTCG